VPCPLSSPSHAPPTARRDETSQSLRTLFAWGARPGAAAMPASSASARARQAGGPGGRRAASLRSVPRASPCGLPGQPARAHVHCMRSGHKRRPNLFGSRSPSASSARAALAPSGLRNHAHSLPRACRPQRDAPPSTKMPGAEVSVTSRSLRVPTLGMSRWSGLSPPCLVSSSRDRRRVPLYTPAKHCDRGDRRNEGRPVAVACRHPGPCLLCMNRLAFNYYGSRVQTSSS
jgi:hypothetical protein